MIRVTRRIPLLLIIMVTFLTSCNKKEAVYDVTREGKSFTIDTSADTITCEGESYLYEIESDNIVLTYPDKEVYTWSKTHDAWYYGLTDEPDWSEYISGEVLVSVLSEEIPRESNKNIVLLIILLIIGAGNAISPYSSWYMSYGWKYKNAEPSDIVLKLLRIGGIAIIVLAIFIWII